MTLFYVIVSIKLCPEVGNDEYIIVCNFGGRRMSGLYKGMPRISILIIVDRTEMPFKLRLKPLSHCQEDYAVHYF